MNWLTQSFIATGAYSMVGLLIIDQVKKGLSSQLAMLIVALTWVPSFGLWAWKKGLTPMSGSTITALVAAGLLAVVGNWAEVEASAQAPNAGLCAAIISCRVILVTIAARVMFDSELSPTQILGVGVCFLGVIIISVAK